MVKSADLNKWQKYYIDSMYDGKMPRSKCGKAELAALGQINNKVIVHFPEFTEIRGFSPAHTEEYIVTEDDCNMLEGRISVEVLAANLTLWGSRGYEIETDAPVTAEQGVSK